MGYTKGTQWDIEKIQNYLDERNTECLVLSKTFTKASDKILFQCKCGKHFNRIWNNMRKQKSFTCIDCSRNIENRKKRNDINNIEAEFKKYGYILLNKNEYVNNESKLIFEDSDGYKYYSDYGTFHTNHSSNKFSKYNIYTIDNIHNYLKLNNIELRLLENKYISTSTKMQFVCNKGHICNMTLNSITSGHKCEKCYRLSQVKDNTSFKKELYDLYQDEYTLLGKYITNKDKIEFKHSVCGKVFYSRPFSILQGNGCPYCKRSKGEKQCEKWLINNNLLFIKEYKFDDLLSPNGYKLRYDFAIFDKDNNIRLLIEYDGEFHYRNIFKSSKLQKQKQYDLLKDNYAKEHNIKLIRIPYWEYKNIDIILEKALLN